MHFTLGISPCPNDTYIFDALLNNKIDTLGHTFTYHLHDVETLNSMAFKATYDITKLSFGVIKQVPHYALLQSGAALGNGVGPLLVTANAAHTIWQYNNASQIAIALPGRNTTAHFLFNFFAQQYQYKFVKKFMPFDEIQNWLTTNLFQKNVGVLIHENRFTYQQHGLHLIQDLGNYWQQQTALPIPLGGIFCNYNYCTETQQQLQVLVHNSIVYANENYKINLPKFVTTNAQEMSEAVMRQHISLYVNEYSLALGEKGNAAIKMLIQLL